MRVPEGWIADSDTGCLKRAGELSEVTAQLQAATASAGHEVIRWVLDVVVADAELAVAREPKGGANDRRYWATHSHTQPE
jgi:hypothetical protein